MKIPVLMTIAVLLVAAPAMASVTDFESYTDGQLAGQQGWAPSHAGSWNVVSGSNSPMNGNKSILVYPEDDCYGPAFNAGATFADGTVGSMYTRPGTGGYMFFNLLNESGNAYAGAYFDGVNIKYAVNGFNWADTGHDHVLNNTYFLSVTLDFTNQKYTLSVQDLANSANNFSVPDLAFGSPTTAASAAAGKFYMGGVHSYFDDLSPAPETPAQTSWFEDFNAGPANAWVGAPWENVTGVTMMADEGYFGTIGARGQGGQTDWGRMFRTAGGANAYMVWKCYLGYLGQAGKGRIGLMPVKDVYAPLGILGFYGSQMQISQDFETGGYQLLCMGFYNDGTNDENVPRITGPSLARGWWEFKIEAVGLQISYYYRAPGAATWNLIGTQMQDSDFAPNYVGVSLNYRFIIDDVGFNTEAPLPGRLKGHVTLQGYTPALPTPVAMSVQFIVSGNPLGPQDVLLDANGDYLIDNVPAGTYGVAYKVAGFLRKIYSPVVITGGEDTIQPVSLVNGDRDGDNEVTSTDLSVPLANINKSGD